MYSNIYEFLSGDYNLIMVFIVLRIRGYDLRCIIVS